jgi:hypothetical protein
MTIASIFRGGALAAALLSGPGALFAQEQLTAPSQNRIIGSPTGHRQPRAADVPATDKTPADELAERQQAELTRKLRICRGC